MASCVIFKELMQKGVYDDFNRLTLMDYLSVLKKWLPSINPSIIFCW